jgi:S-DNA-T family DNA segregation ATPase FtsK/SpoIIIE
MLSLVQRATSSPFARARFMELLGALLFASAVIAVCAMASYHAGDPSFNSVATAEYKVRNWMGKTGSYTADILLQLFGWSSALIVLALLGWGWRLVRKEITRGTWLKLLALIASIASASTLLALLSATTHLGMLDHAGGALGAVIEVTLVPHLTVWGTAILSLAVCLSTLPFALGFWIQEWIAFGMIARLALNYCAEMVGRIVAFFRQSRNEEDEEWEADKKPIYRGKASIDEDEEDEEEDVPTKRNPRLIETSKSRVESKKTRKEVSQSSLELLERHGDYELPATSLMNKIPARSGKHQISESALEQNARMLESVLMDFGVQGEITRVRPGPVVTLYELEPAPGIKSSRVIGLSDDIARSMSAISARIAVIPGRNAIGIELPNAHRDTVYMREMLEEDAYSDTECRLPLVLGKDIGGEPIIADLARMPHLLVAGTTGSGKSVAINTMIASLVYHLTPDECKFIMIDPKMLELSVYDNIPHLLAPVVTEPGKAVVALKWTVKEMENRYRLMSNLGVRNIDSYNKRIAEAVKKGEQLTRTVQTGFDPETGKPITEKVSLEMTALPYIVVIVDEMADLMLVAGKDIETSIQRLAQMARAAGIHIIMATQRPSVDVITGVIKANFPTRISFQVTSKIDSRTILGEQGAEQLLGQGDMLFMAGGGRITRVHGPFIADKEVEKIVDFLKTQGSPMFDETITRDETEESEGGMVDEDETEADRALYTQAVEIVLREQKASVSYIQRRLKIGYNRAARIVEKMEQDGIVGTANHIGKREVLMRSA